MKIEPECIKKNQYNCFDCPYFQTDIDIEIEELDKEIYNKKIDICRYNDPDFNPGQELGN